MAIKRRAANGSWFLFYGSRCRFAALLQRAFANLEECLSLAFLPPFMRYKEKIKDTWFRFIGIPFLAFMSHVIFFNENHGVADEKFTFWQVYLISLVEAMILWEANRLVLLYFRNRYPSLHQSRERVFGELVGCMLVTVLIRYINIWFYDQTLFWGYVFPPEGYWYNIFVGMLYVAIVAGVYEGLYYFQKWKQLFFETEALKRENLQTQLDSLKAQINPHFLFNNLGSLASLVMEDQHRAVDFINELSAVYRYLLQANEKNLTSLEAELRFIGHYFSLLKTRFEEGIGLSTDIEEAYKTWLLPPLTLQILVENAVKHNAILPGRPLQIKIYTTATGNLVVANNRQVKSSPVISNKLGLRNIADKYRLLGKKELRVTQTESSFEVTLPLFKTNMYETIDSGR